MKIKNKELLLLILSILFILIIICRNKTYKNMTYKKTCTCFQHNKTFKITNESYEYVKNYKKELIRNITKLLNDLNIKFSVADGMLLEYERGEIIYNDDDVDIRFDNNDFKKWENFCNNNSRELDEYNLIFDNRFKNIKQQKIDGIQCSLINFDGSSKYKDIDIHLDLISSNVENKFWPDFNINFNNLRKVKIYNVETFIPSNDDAIEYLKFIYGPNYIIPECLYELK
tara:strand:- start:11162 stop:11845 length:684 start_codon:yes stop_codon:yes gene_type:complete